MIDKIQKLAEKWLKDKKVDAIFGLKDAEHVAPHMFTDADELALTISPKIPICYTCRPENSNILHMIQKKYPDKKIGVVARGCDERALIELAKRDQVDLERIKILGVACSKEQAEECRCSTPYPKNPIVGEKVEGVPVSGDEKIQDLLKMSISERRAFWEYELSKCIKCYGCRNVCPMCFCEDCKMEQELWAKTGTLPPELMFLFIRFYHISERCIECAECENACPMDIPLLTIFRLLRQDMKNLFDYEAGSDVGEESPLLTTLDETPMKEES